MFISSAGLPTHSLKQTLSQHDGSIKLAAERECHFDGLSMVAGHPVHSLGGLIWTASKCLSTGQGHIWEKGFAEGALTAALFQDVPPALQRWKEAGIRTYIYSSGSRRAQANLLGHTRDGDLRPLISGYFDTTSGPKVVYLCCYSFGSNSFVKTCLRNIRAMQALEACKRRDGWTLVHPRRLTTWTHFCVFYKQTAAESYEGLQLALGLDYPEQVLFVTDSMSEADAARSAYWRVVLAVRPGNAPLPEHTTPVITTFEELQW